MVDFNSDFDLKPIFMIKQITLPFLLILLIISIFSPVGSFAANSDSPLQDNIDSLKAVVSKCPTDTGKFSILINFYWQHRATERTRIKEIGLWAYEIAKYSDNLWMRSDANDVRGVLYFDELQYDSASTYFLKALNISKKIDYPNRTRWSLLNLAHLNKSLGQTDSALFYFKTLVDFERGQSINTSFTPEALYEIASIYEQLKQPDSAALYRLKLENLTPTIYAKRTINESMKAADNTNDFRALSIIYTQIGELFKDQKKYRSALLYFNKALEMNKATNNDLEVYVLNLIGDLYFRQGNDSLALVHTLKGFQIASEISPKYQLANSYNNLGNIYKHQGKLMKAIDNFKMANFSECDTCPIMEIHSSIIGIADIYLELNQREKALEYYKRSLVMAEASNLAMELAVSNLKIGNFYRTFNDDITEQYYLKAIQLAQNGNFCTITKTIADTLTSFEKAKRNYKAAFEYQSLAIRMADSIQVAESKAITTEWETRFEFEKINLENKVKKEELAKEKQLKNWAALFSGLLIILVLIIFIGYRRKKKDNQLLALQKEEIENISLKLHEADQARLRFFTNISHELRTPLTLIVAPLVKLMKNAENEEIKREYAVILRSSRKLQSLIGQLLDIAKIDKAELALDIKMHDFYKQMHVIVSMFHSLAEEKNIDFTITAEPEELIFAYDAKRMEQIITNLLSNAFKFTPIKGKIAITAARQNESLIFKIHDTGIGIPADSIEKVFDRFYQTDASLTRHFDGSGIGLALVKELVELHRGKIFVISQLEQWTEFTMVIPITQVKSLPHTEEYHSSIIIDSAVSARLEVSTLEKDTSKPTILLVEDNIDLRLYLANSLSDNYNVIEAENGTEGIKLARKEVPDIIISDVMMPETDGYELTSALKRQIETCHIPIILLTAKTGRDSKIEGLSRGADDFINKPFDEEELHLKVKNILRNRHKLQEKFKKSVLTNPSEMKEYSMDDQFIVKLVAIIEKDMSNLALDVEYLGENIGLSRQQLYRKLKAITGQSPVGFIRTIRLKRAAQLIKQKTATISEIAFMTGFDNLSYFSKCFKDEFGLLPSEFGKSTVL